MKNKNSKGFVPQARVEDPGGPLHGLRAKFRRIIMQQRTRDDRALKPGSTKLAALRSQGRRRRFF